MFAQPLRNRFWACTALVACLLAAPFSAADEPADQAPGKQDSTDQRFERIKSLAGKWTGTIKHGDGEAEPVTVSYRVTAAGSAVIETLFEGTPHEMVTMYHQDGKELILTHYCAAKNQPRMKAGPLKGKKLAFDFLDGTNLNAAKDLHMHEATIHFVDQDHLKSVWIAYADGKRTMSAAFDLHRKNPDN